jgi:hypothetical protein
MARNQFKITDENVYQQQERSMNSSLIGRDVYRKISYPIPMDTLILDEELHRVSLSSLSIRMNVFCPRCDDDGGDAMVPAAKVVMSEDGNLGIKCWGDCKLFGWSYQVWEDKRMHAHPDEIFEVLYAESY